MRSYHYPIAAALILALAGCATTRAKIVEYRDRIQRQEQVERIVERTITKPQPVPTEVEKLVRLPPALTQPCTVIYSKDRRVGSITEAYKTGIPYAEDCAKRMDRIRNLQPEGGETAP